MLQHSKALSYLPFMSQPNWVHMGMGALPTCNWIEPDNEFLKYYHNKVALFEQNPERVYGELPESLTAQQEFAERLLEHLQTDHGEHYATQLSPHGGAVLELKDSPLSWNLGSIKQPLWDASLWIQDDVCLLQEYDGQYRLTAASLAAPSSWCLQEKLGKPLFDIHSPVPGLNQAIGSQINHVMQKLSPLRLFQRFNWGIKASSHLALFPDGPAGKAVQNVGDAGAGLFLRVERQTLRRLPQSGAIVFTIRVYVTALEHLTSVPGALAALEAAVGRLSEKEAQYKGLVALSPIVREFFKKTARQGFR